MTLTDIEKREVCAILSVGCDRLAAAKYVNCSIGELRQEMRNDPQFAAKVRRTEAAIETAHMSNVQNAGRDDKHWRASVWWLERRAPERYGRRDAGTVTAEQLESFIEQLIAIVFEELRDVDDRRRLVERLRRVADALSEVRSEHSTAEAGAAPGESQQAPHGEESPSDSDHGDEEM